MNFKYQIIKIQNKMKNKSRITRIMHLRLKILNNEHFKMVKCKNPKE